MKDHTQPIDPVVFREAILALMKHVNEESEEGDPAYDLILGGSVFLIDYFQALGPREAGLHNRSTTRLLALTRLLWTKNHQLRAMVRQVGRETGFHPGLIEAAAVVPVTEDGWFDEQEVLAEARSRVREIELVGGLLGGG